MVQYSYKPCGSWLALIQAKGIMMIMCTEEKVVGLMGDASYQAFQLML
jgi:hypothetical protein